MSIQSIRSVAVGLPVAPASNSPAAPAAPASSRSPAQGRKIRSSDDENVFAPPGVMSRLVRSMRSDEVLRVEAVSRGSELSASKGYPSDTVVSSVVQQMLGGS
jgi:hypothetical protein